MEVSPGNELLKSMRSIIEIIWYNSDNMELFVDYFYSREISNITYSPLTENINNKSNKL